MPSHPDRVRRNYCEHEWREIWGVDIADLIRFGRMCKKCDLIVALPFPKNIGISFPIEEVEGF
jgi:hypothetical protein